jgi:integrase
MASSAHEYHSNRPRERKVSQILAFGDDVRLLNPKLQQTRGRTPRWFIRPLVERPAPDGSITRKLEYIYLEADSKKEALKERTRILERLNKRDVVLAAQLTFGELLDEYLRRHVNRDGVLSASTQNKYVGHIKNHIRPAFESMPLGVMTSARIEAWLDGKREKLSYATRLDLKNILVGIFAKADDWGYWRDRKNPAASVNVGRPAVARPRRKLSIEETRQLLDRLPEDVRDICEVALFCTLRISEVLGLQERDVDTVAGTLRVERRWYRGDVDTPKSLKSRRMVALGHLAPRIAERLQGQPDRFLFAVRTHTTRRLKSGEVRTGYEGRISRDDRDINQHFLRPAAKALGIYYTGFGFHALRVEAITELGQSLSPYQIQRLAGHAGERMTQHYTLADVVEQTRAVKQFQEKVLGPQPVKRRKGAA